MYIGDARVSYLKKYNYNDIEKKCQKLKIFAIYFLLEII